MPMPSIVEVAPPPTAETLQGQNPCAISVQVSVRVLPRGGAC